MYAILRGRNAQADLKTMTLPIDDGSWRHVSADEAWLNGALGYQTTFNAREKPYFKGVDKKGYNTSALATLILARSMYSYKKTQSIDYWRDSLPAMESVISTAFADVMSRTGSVRENSVRSLHVNSVKECQRQPGSTYFRFCPPPQASHAGHLSELHFNGSTTGYTYQASKATDYLSISVLTLYAAVVLFHVVSSLISRRSFTCWDTIEEMVLLAKNSQPSFVHPNSTNHRSVSSGATTPSGRSAQPSNQNDKPQAAEEIEKAIPATTIDPLANTSSGICTFSTMELRLRIKALPSIDHSHLAKEDDKIITTEEVQLVVGDDELPSMQSLVPGQAYGRQRR